MKCSEAVEFPALFRSLRLADQVRKLRQMRELVDEMPLLARERRMSEVVECIEEIDTVAEQPGLLGADLLPVRQALVEKAVRTLLATDPYGPLRWAAMGREEIRKLLARLEFTPAIKEEQIGAASIDLTLGPSDGKRLGDVIDVKAGDFVVVPTLERHGPWPRDVLGFVTVRSKAAQRGVQTDPRRVVHLHSVYIFPGSEGPIQQEFDYLGPEPDRWVVGSTRLTQLSFIRLVAETRSENQLKGGNGHDRAASLQLMTNT